MGYCEIVATHNIDLIKHTGAADSLKYEGQVVQFHTTFTSMNSPVNGKI